MAGEAPPPLDAEAFAGLMAPFAPFERQPRLAVAVSGGADSLALTLLADGWARGQGGSVLALTVDHGLRAESAAEAAQVGEWLAARGIAHRALGWSGPKPAANLQAEAREARYRLLREACRAAGILHLLTAHHRDDQAETLLLRLGRGSGLAGLSGMAAETFFPEARLMRPLLPVPRGRLEATCRAFGQPWIDDPSNDSDRHARVRLRKLAPVLAAEGLTGERLAETAARLGRSRAAVDHAVAALLADGADLHHDLGFCALDPTPFLRAPEEVGLRALAAVLACVGGAAHAPRLESLEAAYDRLGRAEMTVAGCRIVRRAGRWLVVREAGRAAAPVPLSAGAWDGRWEWRPADGDFTIGAVGESGLVHVPHELRRHVPAVVVEGLPALFRGEDMVAVPALQWLARQGLAAISSPRFAPRVGMTYVWRGGLRRERRPLCMQK